MELNFVGKPVRAVIFDIYHTLLEVEAAPVDAAQRWSQLWQDFFGTAPPVSLAEFEIGCRSLVPADHAERRAAGVRWPEVDWRSVACRTAPALAELKLPVLDDFLFQHARLQRTVRAMPGAADFLQGLRSRGVLTGIASNAQRYTLDEMAAAGIKLAEFVQDLCFWSFELGFAKPDPAVFAWLGERLAARGILPGEVLMIGDRLDNDVAPARAAGWQTWHFQGQWPGGGI